MIRIIEGHFREVMDRACETGRSARPRGGDVQASAVSAKP